MTTRTVHYPGTAQHQALLRAIVAHYENDFRVLTVIVFGSLGRGDWDVYSDIDLDIVISDSVKLDPLKELRRLCESFAPLGERVALITPDGKEGGDVMLESLMQLSVRYHTVAQTSPNIEHESFGRQRGRIFHCGRRRSQLSGHRSLHPAIAGSVYPPCGDGPRVLVA